MVDLNGILVPDHYTGIGLHDTPGSEVATWSYDEASRHADLLRSMGVTLYKLFGSGTKGSRAAAYKDKGIVVIHRWWPGGAHWGRPAGEWLMPVSEYGYLLACGVSLFEPGWNEFNIKEEWVTPIPNAAGIATAVLDAWEAAINRYGQHQFLLFPSNTPGGDVDHRLCYQRIVAGLVNRGLQGTVKHVAVHNRPINNPPETQYSATNTCTFDEWRWIKKQFNDAGMGPYFWTTEHGYSLGDGQNTDYPPIDLQKHTDYNWNLQQRMNPAHANPIESKLAGTCHWFEAGWGHWGPWRKDALRDGGDGMPSPSPLWQKMITQPHTFSRYTEEPMGNAKLIDLSHHRPGAPLQTFWDMGYRGVILRISGPKKNPDGTTDYSVVEKDGCFDRFYDEASEIGFLIGGFYFLVENLGGQAGLAHRSIGGRDMPLGVYCDAERGKLTLEKINQSCTALDGLRSELTGLYTNQYLYNKWGIEGWLGDRPLWVATRELNYCPIPGWKLWQKGYVKVDGVNYDDNEYNGTLEQFYAEYAPANGGEPMTILVKDMHGATKSWEWAQQTYGVDLVRARPPAGALVARLVELQESEGPAVGLVSIQDDSDPPQPMPHVLVGEGWADGHSLAESEAPWLSPTEKGQPEGKPHRGFTGRTNDQGDVGFGWGGGEQYDPTQGEVGPHWFWVASDGQELYTDVTLNYGWYWRTNHRCLRPTFRIMIAEENDTSCDVEAVKSLLIQALAILDKC